MTGGTKKKKKKQTKTHRWMCVIMSSKSGALKPVPEEDRVTHILLEMSDWETKQIDTAGEALSTEEEEKKKGGEESSVGRWIDWIALAGEKNEEERRRGSQPGRKFDDKKTDTLRRGS